MSVPEALPSAVREANNAPSDWLQQSEGFQVFGPNGRIGFVALVLSSDEGVDGVVVRAGLFETQSTFVPVAEVGSVVPRRQRLELLTAPGVQRTRIPDFVRELYVAAAEQARFHRDEAAQIACTADGGR